MSLLVRFASSERGEAMTRAKEIKIPAITEKQFTQQVIQLLRLCGFNLVYHTWNSMHSERGFPDIFALRVRDKRLLFAELKSEKGKLTYEQARWSEALKAMGCEIYEWRPSDWDRIVEIIKA